MFVYPEFIAPLFDRYEPLPDGSLKTKIETLAASIKFPLKKLLVVEGSRRSAHSNAYFYGFGKNKRIVIFDTLIRGFKFPNKNEDLAKQETKNDSDQRGCAVDEEILSVIAHELGHWKLGHTIYNLFIGKANLLMLFVIFGLLMDVDDLFISFGFKSDDTPVILRLFIIFQYIFSPYNTVMDFLMTVLSRKFEFQADAFAAKLGYKQYLKSALVILLKDNLSFPVCDWLYSMFNHSHPPLLERLSAIDKCKSD
ncbi:unnamed protein product [Schistosoma mattheei]|nr:unnamed protein product [Schistosoma mattheei]